MKTSQGRKGSNIEYSNLNYGLKICTKIFRQGIHGCQELFQLKSSDLPKEASCFPDPGIRFGPVAKCFETWILPIWGGSSMFR